MLSFSVIKHLNLYIQAIKSISVIVLIGMLFSCFNSENKDFLPSQETIYHTTKATDLLDAGRIDAAMAYIDSSLNVPNITYVERYEFNKLKNSFYLNTTSIPGHLDSALVYGNKMVASAETDFPKYAYDLKATAYFSKADVLYRMKNYSEAYLFYYKGKSVNQTNLHPCTLSDYDYRMAMILYKQKKYFEACEHFKESYTIRGNCELNFSTCYRIQEILGNIGLCYYALNENDSAVSYYRQALTYIDNNKTILLERALPTDVAIAVIKGNLASTLYRKGELSDAKRLLRESIAINETPEKNNHNDAQISRLKLANIFLGENKIDSVERVRNEIIKNYRGYKDVLTKWYWLSWQYFNVISRKDSAYEFLARYTLLKDSLEKNDSNFQLVDIDQKVKLLEGERKVKKLEESNKSQSVIITIVGFAFLLILAIVGLLLRMRNKSKENIKTLTNLNNTITAQKFRLENTLEKLEIESRNKSNILKVIAHDLRSPVASIVMLTDLIESKNKDKEIAEMLDMMRKAGNNTLNLMVEILEEANPSIVDKADALVDVHINDLLKQAIAFLQLKANEKNQKIEYDFIDKPVIIKATEDNILRVINNIVGNAIKFSKESSKIKIKLEQINNKARVSVWDNGIGIPKEMQLQVFELFTKVGRKGTSGEKTYGLGLSICKQIIESFGGEIWFESKEGHGTVFYFTLPVVENEEQNF